MLDHVELSDWGVNVVWRCVSLLTSCNFIVVSVEEFIQRWDVGTRYHLANQSLAIYKYDS